MLLWEGSFLDSVAARPDEHANRYPIKRSKERTADGHPIRWNSGRATEIEEHIIDEQLLSNEKPTSQIDSPIMYPLLLWPQLCPRAWPHQLTQSSYSSCTTTPHLRHRLESVLLHKLCPRASAPNELPEGLAPRSRRRHPRSRRQLLPLPHLQRLLRLSRSQSLPQANLMLRRLSRTSRGQCLSDRSIPLRFRSCDTASHGNLDGLTNRCQSTNFWGQEKTRS